MDIALFSEMLKDLILDNDEVSLPLFGTFVSETLPSSFSDKGYTINPPYRRLSFRQRQGDATMLAKFYSEANGIGIETATKIVFDFVADLKSELLKKKTITLPGLGRLRATRENTFFFIPEEDLDIYPYGFGLESVSLKTHEETPEEVAAAVSDLKAIVDGPAAYGPEQVVPGPEPGPERMPGPGPELEPESEPEPEPKPEPDAAAVVARPVPETGDDLEEKTAKPEEPGRREKPEEPEKPEDPEKSEKPERREKPAMADFAGTRRKPARHISLAWVILASLVVLALLALGIFLLLAHIAPDFIDSILYTPEELRIINHV